MAGPERLPGARALAERLLADVDRTCSRFRDDSDLARANAGAGGRVRVDPLLAAALRAALDAAAATDGLVDPTLGAVIRDLGYDRTFERLDQPSAPTGPGPSAAAVGPAAPARHSPASGGWREVEVDPDGTVLVPAGCELDLGATGKAFAADLVASTLAARGVACVVSLGGDVSVGAPQDDEPRPWRVTVSELPDDEVRQTVVLEGGGLATSTVLRRRWTSGGRTMHHLLDPRTGRPVARRWRSVSVAARTCVQANTASTAGIVLGDEAVAWLDRHGLAARLVARDGAVVHCGGWPDEGPDGPEGEEERWSSS